MLTLIPAIHFYFRYKNASSKMLPFFTDFQKELIRFILGEVPQYGKSREDIAPYWVMKAVKEVEGARRNGDLSFKDHGFIDNLIITEQKTVTRNDETQTHTVESKERGHGVFFPESVMVPESKAVFRFRNDTQDVTRFARLFSRDKRTFDLTDTELSDLYEVSIGGLKDLFTENDNAKMEWTKAITPFFEQVLKAIVAVHGETYLIFDRGAVYSRVRCRMPEYRSSEYGVIRELVNKRRSSNHHEVLNLGETRPKYVVPFLNKILLNRVLYNMISYFFTTDQVMDKGRRERIREELQVFIAESHSQDIDEIDQQYKIAEV